MLSTETRPSTWERNHRQGYALSLPKLSSCKSQKPSCLDRLGKGGSESPEFFLSFSVILSQNHLEMSQGQIAL